MTNMNIRGRQQANVTKRSRIGGKNWAEHERHYQRMYREATYYSSGRDWPDYAPAYRYGFEHHDRYRGRRFEEVESELERDWIAGRGESRLVWTEARGAVRDIWQRIDQEAAGKYPSAAYRKQ